MTEPIQSHIGMNRKQRILQSVQLLSNRKRTAEKSIHNQEISFIEALAAYRHSRVTTTDISDPQYCPDTPASPDSYTSFTNTLAAYRNNRVTTTDVGLPESSYPPTTRTISPVFSSNSEDEDIFMSPPPPLRSILKKKNTSSSASVKISKLPRRYTHQRPTTLTGPSNMAALLLLIPLLASNNSCPVIAPIIWSRNYLPNSQEKNITDFEELDITLTAPNNLVVYAVTPKNFSGIKISLNPTAPTTITFLPPTPCSHRSVFKIFQIDETTTTPILYYNTISDYNGTGVVSFSRQACTRKLYITNTDDQIINQDVWRGNALIACQHTELYNSIPTHQFDHYMSKDHPVVDSIRHRQSIEQSTILPDPQKEIFLTSLLSPCSPYGKLSLTQNFYTMKNDAITAYHSPCIILVTSKLGKKLVENVEPITFSCFFTIQEILTIADEYLLPRMEPEKAGQLVLDSVISYNSLQTLCHHQYFYQFVVYEDHHLMIRGELLTDTTKMYSSSRAQTLWNSSKSSK